MEQTKEEYRNSFLSSMPREKLISTAKGIWRTCDYYKSLLDKNGIKY